MYRTMAKPMSSVKEKVHHKKEMVNGYGVWSVLLGWCVNVDHA